MIEVDTYMWDNAAEQIRKEKQIVALVQSWAFDDPPPVAIKLSPDMGFRCFVRPQKEESEESMHKLLAWFVRKSGKKFFRFFRDTSAKAVWWNSTHTAKGVGLSNEQFGDLSALFLLEDFPLGQKCRIVETEKTIKVKELVCDEARA